MKLTWVVAIALLACSCKKDSDKKKAAADDELPAEDPQCAEKIAPFGEWMKALVADGHIEVVVPGVELATLTGFGPNQITRGAAVVTVKPAEVVIDGKVVADPSKTAGPDLAKLVGPLIEPTPGAEIILVIDGKAPWSTVATVMNAAAAAKHPRIGLVFAAGAPAAADPPPKSSIDAELDARAKAPPAPDPGIGAKVFEHCAAVTQKLFPAIDKLGPSEFDVAVAVGMPEEIKMCGCRVDLAAVQRLMWAWWGRDRGPALAAIRVEIAAVAKDGTDLTMKPDAPWSEASQLVIAAAEQRKPITPH
jgi:hypothetical protein